MSFSVVADLKRLAKDPTLAAAKTAGSIDDFVPPGEENEDFWGADDDSDDDKKEQVTTIKLIITLRLPLIHHLTSG